jgi:membrane-bound lytic murein transglycosylase D
MKSKLYTLTLYAAVSALAYSCSDRNEDVKPADTGKAAPAKVQNQKKPTLEDAVDAVPKQDEDIILNENDVVALSKQLKKDPKGALEFLTDKWADFHRRSGRFDSTIKNGKKTFCYAKKAFSDHGLDENLALLGVAESYWKNSTSPVGAQGIFQFMGKTAGMFGLKIDMLYDERNNPVLSSIAAAKLMKDLTGRLGSELAIAAYNSGKPFGYITQCRCRPTLEGYVKYLGEQLDRIANSPIRFTVKKGQPVSVALKANGIAPSNENISAVIKYNRLARTRKIRSGQVIVIPPELVSNSTLRKHRQVRFILENLNYPPKHEGIRRVLKEDFPDFYSTRAKGGLDIIEYHAPDAPSMHRYRKGETLAEIARRYNVDEKEIKRYNKIKKLKKVRNGVMLKIPGRRGELVSGFIKRHGINDFYELNPQFKGITYIPHRAKIVVPGGKVKTEKDKRLTVYYRL